MKIVRIKDIASELPPDQAPAATAMAIEELCMAKVLVAMHGQHAGLKRYVDLGGHVRFDEEGEPVLLWGEGDDNDPGT